MDNDNNNSLPAKTETTETPKKIPSLFDSDSLPIINNNLHPGGAPWTITPHQWLLVCSIFENGKNILDACEEVGVEPATYYHAKSSFVELSERHLRATKARSHILAEDTIKIADETAEVPDISMSQVRAAESRIQARQWVIERHNAEEYGRRDKLDINSRAVNVNIGIEPGTGEDVEKILAALQGRR